MAMQLRHLSTVVQPPSAEGDTIKMLKVVAVAWAPNNRKLAVCTVSNARSPSEDGQITRATARS